MSKLYVISYRYLHLCLFIIFLCLYTYLFILFIYLFIYLFITQLLCLYIHVRVKSGGKVDADIQLVH